MRTFLFAAAMLTCATLLSAQQSQQQPPKKPTALTLTGCVQKSETAANQFTLADGADIYRLSGMDVRDYVGRRVQVVGAAPRRLKIVGGLVPSPNVAGRASAMDPARASTAAAEAATTKGTGAEPELRIRSIKPITGTCPQ